MGGERGAATVEWTALVLVVSLALGGASAVAPTVDGRPFGAFLAHAIVCASRGGCDDGDGALAAVYGERGAALVREHAPNLVYERGERQLPVDYRDCRLRECAEAPDDPDLDAHRTVSGGHAATAFTRVVRDGDETFLQYWLYYPDSNSAVLGSDRAWRYSPGVRLAALALTGSSRYPGYHRDDWESYQVRIGRSGRASVRASSHGGYQWCKQARCKNRWGAGTGWTRVSRGSHAGHIPLRSKATGLRLAARMPYPRAALRYRYAPQYPGVDLRERTTTAPGLRLVPLERLRRSAYRPLDADIAPPWRKDVYRNPRSDSTG